MSIRFQVVGNGSGRFQSPKAISFSLLKRKTYKDCTIVALWYTNCSELDFENRFILRSCTFNKPFALRGYIKEPMVGNFMTSYGPWHW